MALNPVQPWECNMCLEDCRNYCVNCNNYDMLHFLRLCTGCRNHLDPILVNIIANLGENVNEEEIHVIMNDWYEIDEYGNDVENNGSLENNDTIENNNNNLDVIIPNNEYISNNEYIPYFNDIGDDQPIVYNDENRSEENIQHTSTPEGNIQHTSTSEYDIEAEFQELIRNIEGSNDDVFHQYVIPNYTSDTSDSDNYIG